VSGVAVDHVRWVASADTLKPMPDLAATVALGGEEWERRGAKFTVIDDGEGEAVRSASGICATSVGDIAFSIWDYGDEPTTYLLVAGELSERPAFAELVTTQMRRSGLLSDDVEVAPFSDYGSESTLATPPRSITFEDLFAGAHTGSSRVQQVTRDRALREQKRELVVALARDVILLPVTVLVTLGLSVTSLFGSWHVSSPTSVALIAGSVVLAVLLVASVVEVLRLSFIRNVLVSTPVLRMRLKHAAHEHRRPSD
jgi:hypothetical protein